MRPSSNLVSAVFTGLEPENLQPISRLRRYRIVGASVAAHLALLAVIVFHNPRIYDASSEWLAFGDSAHTYQLIYVPPSAEDAPPDAAKLLFPSQVIKPQPRPHPHQKSQPPKPAPQPIIADAEAGNQNSKAGSPLGTMIDGPISGHEVHIAYSVVYPDPPIDRSALPRDVVGDVVIEVTIDAEGNVVETKLLQTIGHGIDEKVEATLRRWHYRPATLDGTPVASRQDVHFHFPS